MAQKEENREPNDLNEGSAAQETGRNRSIETRLISKSYEKMYLQMCMKEIFDRISKLGDQCTSELKMVSDMIAVKQLLTT